MAAPLTRCGCRTSIKHRFSLLSRCISAGNPILQATQPQTQDGPRKIVLPKRKPRNATSILRALNDSLTKDYDAPAYMFTDDPFLIPHSSLDKRSFSLAKASGKRAADWVMQQLPDHFNEELAEPRIESFMPALPAQHAEDTVEGLEERISRNEPLVAFNSYQALKQKGVEMPSSVQVDLIGLLAFYNSEDPPMQPVPEEQFYNRDIGNESKTRPSRKTWKDHGPAEQVFEEMNEKTPKAYLELLRGRAKFGAADSAYELFQEMKTQEMPITEEVYRVVLSVSDFISDSATGRWTFMQGILAEMAESGTRPTVLTFNAVLYVLARNSRFRECSKWVLQLLQEMKECNVEPSLASYFYVMKTIYHSEEVTSNVLNQILDHLQGKEFVAQEPADYEFFCFAMPRCYINVKDLELAYKIDDLLNTGNNYLLLGDAFKQGIYYTYFLRVLCMFEQIDKIMENYERVTPHAYTPTFTAYDDLLRAIELNEGYQYLPQIWTDLVLFDYTRRTDIIASLLAIMAKRKQPTELQEIYMNITGFIREKFEEEKLSRRLTPFQLNGEMIGNIILINLHAENYQTAWEFFKLYEDNKLKVEKFPSEKSLATLAEATIEEKEADKTLQIIQLMSDCAYPQVDVVAAMATKGLTLTEEQTNFIDDLL